MRTRLADDADEFRVDLGSGAVVDPSRWEGTTMSTMTSVRANGVELGVETFGRDADPLVLLAGGTTMLSWPDSVCERLAAGGRRVVRYDLRDCGASTTLDPEAPGYRLRDLAADAAALVDTLGAATAHLGGVGVGGMVAQVAALDHPKAFSALTLVSTRPVAPGPVDDDLPDHDAATMHAVFSRPMPDWTDRAAVAAFAADGAELLGNDPEQARATAPRRSSQYDSMTLTSATGGSAASDAPQPSDRPRRRRPAVPGSEPRSPGYGSSPARGASDE